MNVLRAAPCVDHPALERFDAMLRSGVSKIVNCEISDLAWIQAGLDPHSRWRSWCTKRCSVAPFRLFGLGCDNAWSPGRHFVGVGAGHDVRRTSYIMVQDEDVFVPRVAARWGETDVPVRAIVRQGSLLTTLMRWCSHRSWENRFGRSL